MGEKTTETFVRNGKCEGVFLIMMYIDQCITYIINTINIKSINLRSIRFITFDNSNSHPALIHLTIVCAVGFFCVGNQIIYFVNETFIDRLELFTFVECNFQQNNPHSLLFTTSLNSLCFYLCFLLSTIEFV